MFSDKVSRMNINYGTKGNTRLITIVAIVVSLVFILSALISAYILRQNSIKDHSEQISGLTVVLSEHAAQTMFSANTTLNGLVDAVSAANVKTEKAYREFAGKKEQFLNLEEKSSANSIIDVITYVGSDGKVINFSRSYPAPDIDLSQRDYFQYLSTHDSPETYFSDPVRNKGNGKWVFYLAKRITNTNREFLGVALVGVSVEVFSQFYEKIGSKLGEGSALVLFKNDQTLLTRWPLVENRIGKKNTGGVFDDVMQNPKLLGQVIFTDAPTAIRENARVKRMIAFQKVSGYPLVVGVAADEELYLASWRSSIYGVFYTTIFSLILVLIGAKLFLKALKTNSKNHHLANHDALTGLPNRLLFGDRLQQTIILARRNNSKFALIYIDLDNLKTINDQHSHAAGDVALCEAAKRMQKSVRASDTVARVGGDEFVILLPNIDSVDSALVIAEKVRVALIEGFTAEGKQLITGASIGVAIYPEHGEDEEMLSSNADKAMYYAKFHGRNRIQLFSDSLDQ